jgi:hypothetical protein
MAGRAEVAALAGEGDQVFVTAVVTFDAGETVVQTAAIEVTEDGLPDFRSQIPETGLIPLFMYPFQLLEIILDAAVIVG